MMEKMRWKEGKAMPVLTQLLVIFGLFLASEALAALLPFAFPASVLAMVLLALLLCGVLKPRQLRESSNFLLEHMMLFFVPVCTSIVTYAQVLLENLWAIVLICLLTTPLELFVTGHVVQLTMKWLAGRGEEHD